MFRVVELMKLFTVGPVACYPEVLEAMGGQMYSHRSEEYLELHYDTVERLQAFIGTGDPIFLFSSTGTGFMEAATRNCVREKLLVCVNGSFGKRFADVAEANGKEAVVLEPPLGEPISQEALDGALDDDPAIEAVAITHNETSAGLINPLEELAEVVKEHGKMLFVDAVSSMGGPSIYGAMRGEGFELAQGYGALKERTFRIGNMGYIEDDDVGLMLEALGRVLNGL